MPDFDFVNKPMSFGIHSCTPLRSWLGQPPVVIPVFSNQNFVSGIFEKVVNFIADPTQQIEAIIVPSFTIVRSPDIRGAI